MNKIGFSPPLSNEEKCETMNTEQNSQVSLFQGGRNKVLLKALYDDLVLKMKTYQTLMRLLPSVLSSETKNVIRSQMSWCITESISMFKILSLEDFAVFRSYAESQEKNE